jgi:hypothetical protein
MPERAATAATDANLLRGATPNEKFTRLDSPTEPLSSLALSPSQARQATKKLKLLAHTGTIELGVHLEPDAQQTASSRERFQQCPNN